VLSEPSSTRRRRFSLPPRLLVAPAAIRELPHQFPMSSLVSSAIAAATAKPKAPAQGGVLEGINPTKFDPKNPIILFIVQVRSLHSSTNREHCPPCLAAC